MSGMRRIALFATALLALLIAAYAAAGYWLAPRLLHDALVGHVGERLGHRLALGEVRVDPWRLTVAIKRARLNARDGTVLGGMEQLSLALDAASLWGDTWRLREAVLSAPRIEFLRKADGSHNWSALLAALPRNDGSAPPRVHVGSLRIERGRIAYEDRSTSDGLRLGAEKIAIRLDGFSTFEEKKAGAQARYTLSAALPEGAQLDSKGIFNWPAQHASGEVALKGLAAPTLARLGVLPVPATGGSITASSHFSIRGKPDSLLLERLEAAVANPAFALSGGALSAGELSFSGGRYAAGNGSLGFERVQLKDALLAASGEAAPMARFAQLSLDALAVSFQERSIGIGRATLAGLDGGDELDAQGASRLAALLAPAPAAPASAGAAQPTAPPAWHLALARFEAQDSAWRLKRESDLLQTTFTQIQADALKIAAASAGGIAADRLAASGGSLHYTQPGTPARAVELRDIALTVMQPRYPQGDPFKVSAAFALQPTGRVSAEGEFDPRALSASLVLHAEKLPLAAAQPWITPDLALRIAEGSMTAEGRLRVAARTSPPTAGFDGQVTLHGPKVMQAASNHLLFGAAALRARSVKFAIAPLSLAIGELDLQAPVGRIEIAEDGSLRLGPVLASAANKPEASASTGRLPLMLGKVRVQEGRLDFADRSIQPAFAIRIDELAGTISNLAASHAATVALAGRVGEFGAAKIHGTLNAFEPGRQTDVTLEMRNIDMASLDPYARRFAGYRIASGKLTGDMRYRVRAGRLEGENRFVLQHLKLGERVASPQAADLPLEMAIALLTDSEGRITLEIPVRGNLGNPEFDFGHIVAQAIGGAIGKIVTAPFRLLAGLFGGGEEAIDRVYFDPGSAKLAPPEREKIAALARALAARPQLGLRVAAAFDGATDAEALRSAKVAVDPDALAALARARAESVRDGLLARGIDAGRIDLATPGTAQAEARLGVPAGLSLSAR